MPIAPGTYLGPYEIVAPVGAGGMGEVYRARDTRLDRIVAIKVSQEQFSERFEREARAVAALNHPHICQLYDVGPNYLVMEFVEGSPLKGPLPLDKAVEYAEQILDALDAAHHKGITHRDLKPGNILVSKTGIKLLDFGLAKQSALPTEADSTLTAALTGQGQILGTLQYMSPEQMQGKEADPRSDLFSFGCVLYEMLTGKRAFDGQSAASVIAAILEREPAPMDAAPPLERVLRRCLAKDSDQRFQTARDLKAALTWAVDQPPGAPATKTDPRRWIAAAVALAVLATGSVWTVKHFSRTESDQRVLRLQIDPPAGGRFIFGLGFTPGGVALSPDGRVAAFVASSGGKTGLWVQPLDSATARLLAGTEGASYPFWSPDSKSVAFFAEGALQRVDLVGGTPFKICDVEASRFAGGAWSGDGFILIGSAVGILRVPASGGTPAHLTKQPGGYPQVLPGGRFLYWTPASGPGNSAVYATSMANPDESVRVLTTDTNALFGPGRDGKSYLLLLRGSTLLAQEFDPVALKLAGEPQPLAQPVASFAYINRMNVAVSANGLLLYSASNPLSQFRWFDRAGRPLGVAGEPGEFTSFRLSPDGLRAAVIRGRPGGNDMWLLEIGRGVANRFTSNSSLNTYPVWSPDGQTIVFSSESPPTLFRRHLSAAAGGDHLTTSTKTFHLATDWSRDGRFILYFELGPGTQEDLWYVQVPPEGKPATADQLKPYLHTAASESNGRFSPEANPRTGPRWVAYQSDESGRNEVYIDSFPAPRRKFRISTDGGAFPEWGPPFGKDGRELFYVSPDYKLMLVNLTLGTDSVAPSAPRALFALPADVTTWSPFQVTSDGQRFLVRATPEQQGSQPLNVIVNWPSLLKDGSATH